MSPTSRRKRPVAATRIQNEFLQKGGSGCNGLNMLKAGFTSWRGRWRQKIYQTKKTERGLERGSLEETRKGAKVSTYTQIPEERLWA